jgi:predicted tellurium resistance membrane protein TerC
VTTDMLIVFTSSAFAILGLRALYFVLAGAMERFTCLSQGLAVMLAFIGAKMILAQVVHIPTVISLGIIVTIIAAAVGLSVWKERRLAARERRLAAAAAVAAAARSGLRRSHA